MTSASLSLCSQVDRHLDVLFLNAARARAGKTVLLLLPDGLHIRVV